ncbi:ankyrin repeats (3 copies) domain-containing protein [Trichoderma breve]|uniref:Ankyrin repeats (3 copies) domain-containing protein n=1 Tax=Trichoderma breve TaxID=2034170 RepID=A0A9W9BB32_9HYPO|nr:ankyrin repeats (3 copies) domain-containing protein [Trichoderma breve]KAJ4859870.1 ankyrin repeats (3 copies) domain-containing protein [Trichoderma breve]
MTEEAPSSGEDPGLIMEPNLAPSIQEVSQELEADSERLRNEDQADAMDAISVETTTDQIFNPPTEPQSELEQRKLGLSIIRNLGWSGSNYDDYDVITVHGIRDDYTTAWIDREGSWWIKNKLFHDLSARQIDYSYEIHENSDLYETDGLRLHAERLVTAYANVRRELEDTERDRPIIWVCHDLGGTIVKEALSMALARPDKFGRIAMLTTTIVFLGSPHQFHSFGDLEDQLLALILLQGPAIRTQLLKKVKMLANQVERANQTFLSTKLFYRVTIFNIFTHNTHDVKNQRSFKNKAAHTSSMKNNQEVLDIPTPITPFADFGYGIGYPIESAGRFVLDKVHHLDMVRGDGPDESWVTRILSMFNIGGCPIKLHHRILTLQACLLSLAPPTRQFDVSYDPMMPKDATVCWIVEQKLFAELNKTYRRPEIIHLHADGSPHIDIRDISRRLYATYDDSRVITSNGTRTPIKSVIYFEFDQWDSRYNNISSMLLYFINVMSWRFWPYNPWLEDLETPVRDTKYWSLETIWHFFIVPLFAPATFKLTFFIGCFDQCPEEERKWFLQRILLFQSYTEQSVSFILSTSGKDGLATESLSEDRRINMHRCPALNQPTINNTPTDELRSGLFDLISRRPVYEIVQLQLEALLEQCSDMPYLGFIILRWLSNYRRGTSKSEIVHLVRQLSPVTVENTVRVFVSSLRNEDQSIMKDIYNWIKYAAEPWTPESLSEALTVHQQLSKEITVEEEPSIDDVHPEDLVLRIEQVFGGIIVILNRDIKFSHTSFYNVCIDGTTQKDDEERGRINGEIATACLRYFQLKGTQEKLMLYPGILDGGPWTSLLDATAIAHQRDSMAEYAVRFWPQHYNSSGKFKPKNLVHHLFSVRAARAAWEVPFFFFSNPLTRINRSYVSSLPIFARLGFEDLIDEYLECNKNEHGFFEDCWYAVTEASRVGYKTIVQRLLEQLPVDESELKNSLFWAAAYGRDGVADILLEHIPNLSTFQWPEHISYQAAAAGLDNILAALIQAGHNMNEPGPLWSSPPVLAAAWWNQTSTVEFLVDSDAKIDLSICADDGDNALMVASQVGEPHMVDTLLRGGANVHYKNTRGVGPVYKATAHGKYKALKCLLAANAEFENDLEDDAIDIYIRLPLLDAVSDGNLECTRLLLDESIARQNAQTSTAPEDVPLGISSSSHTHITCMLLENGPIPPNNTPSTKQLLLEAIESDNIHLVSLLIEHGASVDAFETPLTLASKNCSIEIVSLLLKNGADINEMTKDGWTESPLFRAIEANNVEVAMLLLKKDANLNWRTDLGWGILNSAYKTPEVIPELLQKDLDRDHQCIYGSVLHMAARWGYPKTMKVLLESDPKPSLDLVYGVADIFSESVGPEYIIEDELGLTALLIACQNYEPECVELLLKAGADPYFRGKDDIEAIDILMRVGDLEKAERCLRMFLSGPYKRSAAQKLDKQGNTLLHKIEKKTLISVLQLLVKAGVPVDSKNRDGYTPLAVAVHRGNEAAAKYLIECGASRASSILHSACIQGSLNLVKLLIQEGADPEATEPENGRSLLYTALHIDDEAARIQMVRYLVDKVKVPLDQPGGQFKYPIIRAAHRARGPESAGFKALKLLIRRKARLDVADDQGRRAVHVAAACLCKDGLSALVRAGADINVRDKLGRLPIHFAASVCFEDNLEYLLGRFEDIDVNATDDDNWTPLIWASRTGSVYSAAQLRERGADVWVRGRRRVEDSKPEDTWSALKMARFSDRSSRWYEHLAPKESTRTNSGGGTEEWNDSLHRSLPGDLKEIFCESCLTEIRGIRWECQQCAGQISFCFKCFGRRDDIHDTGHSFEEIGPLYKQTVLAQRRDSVVDPGDLETDLNLADGSRLREEMEAVVDGELDAIAPGNEASSDIDLDYHSEDTDSSSEF